MKDKKTQIIETAIRLFVEEWVSVPTSQIAKGAGVSNGTLFNYFATKQSLIDGVYYAVKKDMAKAIMLDYDHEKGIEGLFFNIWTSYIAWAGKKPLNYQVIRILQASNALSDDVKGATDYFFSVVFDELAKGVREGILIDAPVAYLCEVTGTQLSTAVSYMQKHKLGKVKLEEHVQASFKIFWNGISI